MAYDLEEQESLAEMKAWWDKYGTFVLSVVTVVLLAIAAWNGWNWYQRNQAAQAAAAYSQLEIAINAKDSARAKEIAGSIMDKYSGSIYGSLTALQAAKLNYDLGDAAAAKAQLTWVVDKSGHDELGLIARVRLAGILLDEKQYDAALKALEGKAVGPQAVSIADRRGDVLAAQGKPDEARAAWESALAANDAQHPLRPLIQLKLDALPAK
ncbi:MAG: tetratricopeptide repeat protein [Burkholderiaceae bacterium]